MGLFDKLFGKKSAAIPSATTVKDVRKVPDGAITEPSIALKVLIRYAKKFLADDEELYSSHLDTTFYNNPQLLDTPNFPEIELVYRAANDVYRKMKEARDTDTYPHDKQQYDNWMAEQFAGLRQALQNLLTAAPYVWYENEVQARKFYVTGTFKHGSQSSVIEHLEELGGTYSKWGPGFYCDMLVVGSKTKPDMIEKRQKELDEYRETNGWDIRLVMEDDLSSIWTD